MRLLILIPIILLCGCLRVVTDSQLDIVKQSAADAKAAGSYIKTMDASTPEGREAIKLAATAITEHALHMLSALEIKLEDLPGPRVSVSDWKYDPKHANEQTMENLKKDDYSVSTMVSVSVVATMLAGIGLKFGANALSATPIGGVVDFLSTIFGHSPQVKRDVHDKIINTMEDYKQIDPAWETNKLYMLLSKRMTQAEKDYIKKETA